MAGSVIPEDYIKGQHTVEEYLVDMNTDITKFEPYEDKVVEIELDREYKKYKLGRIIKLWKIINDAGLQDREEEYDFFIKNEAKKTCFIEYDAIEGIIPPNYNSQAYKIYLYKIYEVNVDDNKVVSYRPAKMMDLNLDVYNHISTKIKKDLPDPIDGSEVDINDFLKAYRINNTHPAVRKDYDVNNGAQRFVYGIWKKEAGSLEYLSVTYIKGQVDKFRVKVEWKDARYRGIHKP